MVGRARRFLGRHLDGALLGLLLLILVGGLLPFLPSRAARAEDREAEDLKTIVLSNVGVDQRLMALEALKKLGTDGALDALEEVARKGDLPAACGACAQLGQVSTSTAKDMLKGLLEDEKLGVNVRMAAAACIAEHWKDEGDLAYLEKACAGNEDLSAFCGAVAKQVYSK